MLVPIILASIVKEIMPQTEEYYKIVFNPYCYTVYLLIVISFFAYLFFPTETTTLIKKICIKKAKDLVGTISDSDEEWKKKFTKQTLNRKESEQALKEINNTDDHILSSLIHNFKEGKLELVITEIKKHLTKDLSSNIKFKLRVLMELSYSQQDELSIQERIENLELICCSREEKIPLEIHITFEKVLALLYMENKQMNQAAAMLNQILCETKDQNISNKLKAQINDLKASLLIQTNRPFIAVAYLKRAIELSSNSILYEYKLASLYFHGIYNPSKALEYAQKAFSHLSCLKQDDDLYHDLTMLCIFLESFLGNFEKAYSYAEESNISDPYFLACKSYVAYKLGHFKEAKNLSQQALKQDSTQVTAINVQGLLYLHNKEYLFAKNCFEGILSEFEKDSDMYSKLYTSEIYYHKGICNLKLNNIQQAIKDFQKAESLGFTEFNAKHLDELNQYFYDYNSQNETKN